MREGWYQDNLKPNSHRVNRVLNTYYTSHPRRSRSSGVVHTRFEQSKMGGCNRRPKPRPLTLRPACHDSDDCTQALALAMPPPASMRWLPDETLFSLSSRHHRLSAQSRASHTSRALFGHPRGGLAHDLPDRVDALVERTAGALGSDARSLIRRHTILPFYLPFRSPADADAAIVQLRGPGIGSLKFRLGMLTSRFRAHHPLKLCLRCATDDCKRLGVPP